MPPFILIPCLCLVAVALVIILTLSVKGTLTIEYNGELCVYFKILCFRIPIYPQKEKRKIHRVRYMSRGRAARIRRAAERKEARKFDIRKLLKKNAPEKKPQKAEKQTTEKKSAPSLRINDILDVLQLTAKISATLVKRFSKRLRIKVARLKVKVASPDVALTAVAYGAVTQTVNVLLPILSEIKNFDLPKKRQFEVVLDYLSEAPEIDMKISFCLRTWHLLDIPLAALFKTTPEVPRIVEMISHYTKNANGENEEEKTQEQS